MKATTRAKEVHLEWKEATMDLEHALTPKLRQAELFRLHTLESGLLNDGAPGLHTSSMRARSLAPLSHPSTVGHFCRMDQGGKDRTCR